MILWFIFWFLMGVFCGIMVRDLLVARKNRQVRQFYVSYSPEERRARSRQRIATAIDRQLAASIDPDFDPDESNGARRR